MIPGELVDLRKTGYGKNKELAPNKTYRKNRFTGKQDLLVERDLQDIGRLRTGITGRTGPREELDHWKNRTGRTGPTGGPTGRTGSQENRPVYRKNGEEQDLLVERVPVEQDQRKDNYRSWQDWHWRHGQTAGRTGRTDLLEMLVERKNWINRLHRRTGTGRTGEPGRTGPTGYAEQETELEQPDALDLLYTEYGRTQSGTTDARTTGETGITGYSEQTTPLELQEQLVELDILEQPTHWTNWRNRIHSRMDNLNNWTHDQLGFTGRTDTSQQLEILPGELESEI